MLQKTEVFENGNYFVLDLLSHSKNSIDLLKNKKEGHIKDKPIFVIAKSDLIEMIISANRPKDLLDIENLTNEK